MHGAYEFLAALTIVLGVAAVTTVLFQRLRQPVVLGYLLAGLIIGPHVPIPLVADPEVVHTLSELGVILLMFALGLEFDLRKLLRAAPTAGVTAVIQCSVMIWLGYVAGRLLGWTAMESIFAGAIVAVSSTTIIAKAFDEQQIRGRLRELVVAILIVEDLIAVFLMALLTAVASGSGVSASELGGTLGRLAVFLGGLLLVGMLVVPRVMRAIVRLERAETTIVSTVGLCFAVSLLAHELGYSVALGAFIAGMLVAESGEVRRIEPLLHPVRDVFAAIFFVSVGMMIDPGVIADQWLAVLVFTLVVVLGKIVSVAVGAFLTGNGTRTSVAAGLSLAQIGEFSFIIAGLGLTLGVVGEFLYPVAVAVSAITTLVTPWLIRGSDRAARVVDHSLPRPLQTFVVLYESWIERLRTRPARAEERTHVRRLARRLLLDAAVVAAIVVGASLALDEPHELVIAAVAAAPFCIGILRVARRLAVALADRVVGPVAEGAVDLGRAPRMMLVATLHLAGVLIAGLPLVALTAPFLPGGTAALVLLLLVIGLVAAFWRTATDLEGHVRASAQLILEVLAAQSGGGTHDALAPVGELAPGLGDPVRVEIPTGAEAAGRSLRALDLRGVTGATVLAIVRDGQRIAVPGPEEVLRPGDVLAVVGSHQAVGGAVHLLTRRPP
jgi:CPA2 family monovalent cation:H+ antiporter-2